MDLPVVEVDGLDGAFYTAYMKANHKEFITVIFENNLEQEIHVPCNEVRLPPSSNWNKDIGVGEEVEVFLATSDQEPCGWWLAIVKMIQGQHYLVEYTANGAVYHMFTIAEYIRRRNPNRPGTSLPEFCISVREKLSDMQEATNRLEAATPAERECKEVYKSTTRATPEHATHQKKAQDTAKNVQVANPPKHDYKEVVRVRKDLMGLAIGIGGKNIQRARNVPGVIDVILPKESCTFSIYGKTPEAVRQAKAMLAFREACCQVPEELVDKVIGVKGTALQEIVVKSGVVEIMTDGGKTFPRLKGMFPLGIVGTEEKISSARALLKERVSCLQSTVRSKADNVSLQRNARDTATNGKLATHPNPEYEEVVNVRKDLMGLAIGSRGKNIQSAQKVPGVTAIILPKGSCTFSIYGKTPEAVQQAKAMLAFKEECFQVPGEVVHKVIGDRCAALNDIVFKSGVVEITKDRGNTFPRLKGMVPLRIVGTEEKIKTACALLQDRVTHF